MSKIDKNELFRHLSGFLKDKGIELQEGPYTRRLRKGCGLLADTVNLSQQALERAKVEIDKRLDQMRQVIHEKTAPKRPPSKSRSGPSPAPGQPAAAKAQAKNTSKTKTRTLRRRSR